MFTEEKQIPTHPGHGGHTLYEGDTALSQESPTDHRLHHTATAIPAVHKLTLAEPADIDITTEKVKYVLSSGRSKGQIRPAFIVKTWGSGTTPAVNLAVLTDRTNDFEHGQNGADGTLWATSVSYSEEKLPGTWHR